MQNTNTSTPFGDDEPGNIFTRFFDFLVSNPILVLAFFFLVVWVIGAVLMIRNYPDAIPEPIRIYVTANTPAQPAPQMTPQDSERRRQLRLWQERAFAENVAAYQRHTAVLNREAQLVDGAIAVLQNEPPPTYEQGAGDAHQQPSQGAQNAVAGQAVSNERAGQQQMIGQQQNQSPVRERSRRRPSPESRNN